MSFWSITRFSISTSLHFSQAKYFFSYLRAVLSILCSCNDAIEICASWKNKLCSVQMEFLLTMHSEFQLGGTIATFIPSNKEDRKMMHMLTSW